MQTSLCLYPTTLERAFDVADQIKLDLRRTHIEPSRFSGFLFDHESAATLFRLTFNARYWPTKVDDLFLMYVERSPEVSAWVASCGYEFEPVEIVAIWFESDEDQESFENVIWPGR
jgi:hypothetical protein